MLGEDMAPVAVALAVAVAVAATQQVPAISGVQLAGRLPAGWGAAWILPPCIKCISRCDFGTNFHALVR